MIQFACVVHICDQVHLIFKYLLIKRIKLHHFKGFGNLLTTKRLETKLQFHKKG